LTAGLPECESVDDAAADNLVARIVADRSSNIEIAVSNFGLDESDFDEVYGAFECHYEEKVRQLCEVLGSPIWEGAWTSDDYPEWAWGEHITLWDHASGKIYLRIYNEEEMAPIIVALGTDESENGFNANGDSQYADLRAALKLQEDS